MKETTLAARLVLADTQHYVEDGMLHLTINGEHAASLALVPLIDGEPLDIASWSRKGDAIVGSVRGNGGSVHLSKSGNSIVYRVKGRFAHARSVVYFQTSLLDAEAYHVFVPDRQAREFEISKDGEIVVGTTPGGSAEHQHNSSVITPAPRDIAFSSGGRWWGISIPGALPVGETRFSVRRKKLSIEFDNYEAANTGGDLPDAHIVVDLDTPYSILDADHAACKARKEAGIRKKQYRWWSRPLFSTFGEQSQGEHPLDPQRTTLNGQKVIDWTRQVSQNLGTREFTVVIDGPWFDKYGDFNASIARFGGTQGMRELINELHEAGHKVVLWFTPFRTDRDSEIALTEPDCLLLDKQQELFTADGYAFRDYTSVVARNTLHNNLRYCLSDAEGCLDADGLKIDLCRESANPALAALHNNRWGYGDEYLARILQHIHSDAHNIKPDCLIMAAGAQAYLEPHVDMLRLDHLEGNGPATWHNRARIVHHITPGCLLDTDGWPMSHERLPQYLMTAPVFGVPAISCVASFDKGKPMHASDYRRWSAALHVYLNAPTTADMQLQIDPETGLFTRTYARGMLKGSLAAACYEKTCLVTFSSRCVRATAVRDTTVRLPLSAKPVRVEAVFHDGSREPIAKRGAVRRISLDVPDAASEVKCIEVTLENSHAKEKRAGED